LNSRSKLRQRRGDIEWRYHHNHDHVLRAADLSADFPQEGDDEPPVINEVFPRLKEGNEYRVLGISEEATFEEVQEARNFLYEAYKHHEASREKIEWAFEKILKASFKNREKFGFQPPKTGRKTDVRGAQLAPTLVERVKDALEPDVSLATCVNDGSIFLALGLWAAWQVGTTDPTFPMALTLVYTGYKFFTKRKNRNPDGPFLGGSPLWPALGMTVLAFLLGSLVSITAIRLIPLPASLPPDGVALFIVCTLVGLFTLFFR
jgi:ATP-dependent HslUV protease ATP-binding subunit HslU